MSRSFVLQRIVAPTSRRGRANARSGAIALTATSLNGDTRQGVAPSCPANSGTLRCASEIWRRFSSANVLTSSRANLDSSPVGVLCRFWPGSESQGADGSGQGNTAGRTPPPKSETQRTKTHHCASQAPTHKAQHADELDFGQCRLRPISISASANFLVVNIGHSVSKNSAKKTQEQHRRTPKNTEEHPRTPEITRGIVSRSRRSRRAGALTQKEWEPKGGGSKGRSPKFHFSLSLWGLVERQSPERHTFGVLCASPGGPGFTR